jgi:hypothetical protein
MMLKHQKFFLPPGTIQHPLKHSPQFHFFLPNWRLDNVQVHLALLVALCGAGNSTTGSRTDAEPMLCVERAALRRTQARHPLKFVFILWERSA